MKDSLKLQTFRDRVSTQVLPTSEIAKLAAILAHGRDITNPQNLKFIAIQAIALWQECENARRNRIDMLAIHARAETIQDALPNPKNYPVTVVDFLNYVMPNVRRENQMKFFREWMRKLLREENWRDFANWQQIPLDSVPVPNDSEVANYIAEAKKDGFNQGWFGNAFMDFLNWLPKYKATIRAKRARAGAIAKWKNKNAKTKENYRRNWI